MEEYPDDALIEQPLSEAAWRTLMLHHPAYTYRRYLYQTHLFATGCNEFDTSLRHFATTSLRSPEQFIGKATGLLHQMERMPALTRDQEWLWSQITTQPYDVATALDDMASLPAIYATLLRTSRIMVFQGKPFLLANERYDQFYIHHDWHTLAKILAILMEELSHIPVAITEAHDQHPAILDPYPNETVWQTLFTNDPSAAWKWYVQLTTHQADVPFRLHFNAYESLLLYNKLRNKETA